VTNEPDPFGTLGEKYMFLLQLPRGSAAVLQGPYWESLYRDFEAAGLRPMALSALLPGTQIDGAFLETSAGALLGRLTPSGSAVVLSRPHLIPASWRRARFRRIARACGFTIQAEFRPFPTIERPEVFLSPDANAAEWELRPQIGIRTVARVVRPHGKHRLWFLSRSNQPASGLLQAGTLASQATGDGGLWVERFHLRRRGALVLVMAGANGRRLLRIATNRSVAELTRRNHSVLKALRARGLPEKVQSLLPAPLGEARHAAVEAFAEEFKPGRLAWTLYRNSQYRERIDADLFQFSHQLQAGTRRHTILSQELLEAFIDRHLDAIRHRLGDDRRISDRLDAIGGRIRQMLENRSVTICVGHGDYGIGNALASPDGAVTAIIDWDQFEEVDLPGIDWCDYLLKANHYRYSVKQAFGRVLGEVARTGCLAADHQGFGANDFGLTAADLRLIPCLAVLREMNRAARFPGELRRDIEHYRDQLEMVGRCLSGDDA
jgi:hypothetical protein